MLKTIEITQMNNPLYQKMKSKYTFHGITIGEIMLHKANVASKSSDAVIESVEEKKNLSQAHFLVYMKSHRSLICAVLMIAVLLSCASLLIPNMQYASANNEEIDSSYHAEVTQDPTTESSEESSYENILEAIQFCFDK